MLALPRDSIARQGCCEGTPGQSLVEIAQQETSRHETLLKRGEYRTPIPTCLPMSNRRIVSYEKLDQSIRKMIKSNYPDGFDGQTFNLRLPTSKEVFKMIRFEADNIQYMIKVGPAIEGVDYTMD